MTTSTQVHASPDSAPSLDSDTARDAIVVATDGTPESDSAILLARALSGAAQADLHAISVCEDILPASELPLMFAPPFSLEDPEVTRAHRRAQVSDQMLRLLGPGHGVWTSVQSGTVGDTIASFAMEHAARLIVTGRGRHGVADRLFGEEHMLRLLRATRAPVLMANPGLASAPRRVVIGLDFSKRDRAAADVALRVIAEDAKVFFVHVKPDLPFAAPTDRSWLAPYHDTLRGEIEELKAALPLLPSHSVETVLLTGHPGKALSDFADRADADLIVAGIHGLGFMHRLVVGSTMTYLLRSAPCSLLAAPDAAHLR